MAVELDDRLRQTHTPRPARTPAPLGELQSSGDIRILILDDDPATCSVIQAALSNRDFQIDTVSDPMLVESVLSRRGHYHLIIMDYVMPGLEADQVFGWVRDYQPEANVVVVTGYPSVDSALSCLRARTYDYVTKPFQVDHLRDIVVRCLESKGLLRMTEEALRESLGAAIRERRKSLGFTLSNMSERTGVSLGLPVADRAGEELGVDRDAVPDLPGAGDQDERTIHGGAAELIRARSVSEGRGPGRRPGPRAFRRTLLGYFEIVNPQGCQSNPVALPGSPRRSSADSTRCSALHRARGASIRPKSNRHLPA